jgi:hypothetical protein
MISVVTGDHPQWQVVVLRHAVNHFAFLRLEDLDLALTFVGQHQTQTLVRRATFRRIDSYCALLASAGNCVSQIALAEDYAAAL